MAIDLMFEVFERRLQAVHSTKQRRMLTSLASPKNVSLSCVAERESS